MGRRGETFVTRKITLARPARVRGLRGLCRDRNIAAIGLRDLVIAWVGETLLVCPKDRVQDVKRIVDQLAREGREDLL